MEMCARYNVKLTAPANIGTFSNLLQQISDAKHKNINLLQEDIQAEIRQQETFVRQQIEQIKSAEQSVVSLTDCQAVLKVARANLSSLEARSLQGGQPRSPLLDVESGPDQNALLPSIE